MDFFEIKLRVLNSVKKNVLQEIVLYVPVKMFGENLVDLILSKKAHASCVSGSSRAYEVLQPGNCNKLNKFTFVKN